MSPLRSPGLSPIRSFSWKKEVGPARYAHRQDPKHSYLIWVLWLKRTARFFWLSNLASIFGSTPVRACSSCRILKPPAFPPTDPVPSRRSESMIPVNPLTLSKIPSRNAILLPPLADSYPSGTDYFSTSISRHQFTRPHTALCDRRVTVHTLCHR